MTNSLWRATGKGNKKTVQLQLDGTLAKVDGGIPRNEDDLYETPPEATRGLIFRERDRWREIGGPLWEPASGNFEIVKLLEEAGFNVAASDLRDRGHNSMAQDFFAFRKPLGGARILVTNPPFNCVNWRDGKGRWIIHAMEELGIEYMALLLSWSWPGAGGLGPLWEKHKPARVYLMRWKLDFTKQGSPPLYFGWFIWEKGSTGEPPLLMMDRRDADQAELF